MREYFPKLLGNFSTKQRIGASIEKNTLPHAFLISGPSGCGKSVLATEIAAALNCEKKGEVDAPLPCGRCNTCKRIYEENFTDVKTLFKKKDRATVGVDEVKDMREDMFLSSTESDYKIYVFDDAETMTTEAQNALLKVLEEPPVNVIILLLARESDRILTTIKSRTQFVAMTRFSNEELLEHLLRTSSQARSLKVSNPDKLYGIIMSADGKLGYAQRLADPKMTVANEEERSETLRIIDSIHPRRGYTDILSAVSSLPQKRAELISSLERITLALRDLIVLKHDAGARLLFFISKEEAEKASAGISLMRLLSVYHAINEAHELCSKNANITNLVTNLSARIKSASILNK